VLGCYGGISVSRFWRHLKSLSFNMLGGSLWLEEVRHVETASRMVIKILQSEGCDNAPRAVQEAERAVANLGMEAEVQTVLVGDENTALKEGFRGSPTVTVNGVDADPDPPAFVGMAS